MLLQNVDIDVNSIADVTVYLQYKVTPTLTMELRMSKEKLETGYFLKSQW